MDEREERSRSKKAILGVVLAVVMVAMIGNIGAYSTGGQYNIIEKYNVNRVLIGQDLVFNDTADWSETQPVVYRYAFGDLENTYTATLKDGKYYFYNVNWPTTGAFYVNGGPEGCDAPLSVEDPDMPLKLKREDKEVSSIVRGTPLTVDVGGINLFNEDIVDLVIIGPNGMLLLQDGVSFTNITSEDIENFYGY